MCGYMRQRSLPHSGGEQYGNNRNRSGNSDSRIRRYRIFAQQIPHACLRCAYHTPAHTPVEYRLSLIYNDMNLLLDKYKPDEMAIEELFFNSNTTTAISVAEARGVILLSAARKSVAVSEYTPLQVKQSVVGYGKADKKQVILMVKTILGLDKVPKLDDTADALAIAICHAHSGASRLKGFYNIV